MKEQESYGLTNLLKEQILQQEELNRQEVKVIERTQRKYSFLSKKTSNVLLFITANKPIFGMDLEAGGVFLANKRSNKKNATKMVIPITYFIS